MIWQLHYKLCMCHTENYNGLTIYWRRLICCKNALDDGNFDVFEEELLPSKEGLIPKPFINDRFCECAHNVLTMMTVVSVWR